MYLMLFYILNVEHALICYFLCYLNYLSVNYSKLKLENAECVGFIFKTDTRRNLKTKIFQV